jgi:signal transduction histidine kinase
MSPFVVGIIVGGAAGLAIAAAVALILSRRFLALQAKAREAERLAELGTLTGGLAHEIKNPLSTVGLNLQLLMEDIPPEDPLHARLASRLGTVQRETTRLRDILDDFLRYAGRLELDRKRVELNALLDELVDFFAPQAQAQRVQLRLQRSEAPVEVLADARLLKQALLNLMLNGLQAMGDSGGDLILRVSASGGDAIVDVIDTGRGIAPEVQNRIFQAYVSMRKGGTGLGLAMSKRIIAEHGGAISLESEPGKGTDFRIILPRA